MPMNVAVVRPARALAEAKKKQKKLQREQRQQQRAVADDVVREALRRAARPRAQRLREVLQGGYEHEKLKGPLHAFRFGLGLLRTIEGDAYARAVDVVCAVEAAAPGLALVEVGDYGVLGRGIVRLAAVADRFVRPVSTWQAPRRQPERVWQSLVQHVLHKFAMSPAWNLVFTDSECPDELRNSVVDVANGGSWRSVGLPTFITRTVAHALGTVAAHVAVDNAVGLVRDAQCRALGVSPAHRKVVCNHEDLDGFLADDTAFEGVLAFFARHPELSADDVKIVCAAMAACETTLPSMKGRTPKSLLAMCKALVRDKKLRDAGRLDVGAFVAPVVDGGSYVVVDDKSWEQPTFVIEALRTGQALIEEGIAMRHCVGTYAERARSGEVIIFGVRTEIGGRSKRALTIEVAPKDKAIVQIRGRCNRRHTPQELGIVTCWAAEQGLRLPA